MNVNSNNQDLPFPFIIYPNSREGTSQENTLPGDMTASETVQAPNIFSGVIPKPEVTPQTNRDFKPSPFDYAQYIVRVTHLKKYKDKVYQYHDGCYHVISEDKLIHIIMSYCGNEMMKLGTVGFVTQVAKAIQILPEIYCDIMPVYPDLIPFPNGLLSISTMQFVPPNPDFFVRYSISVPYNGTNLSCPVFCSFLNVVTQGNSILQLRLLEIIGYLLSAQNDAKKFFVFVGVSNSGKSVMIQLIQSLLNQDSIYCADMNSLGDKFTTGYMNGSHLCVFADMPNARISDQAAGIIKALTGGDTIIGEMKYQAPEVIMNETKLLFSTNHTIQTSSFDPAFMNRCCIQPFMHGIPVEQQDSMLLDKLLAERQAIVHMAINAYLQMKQRYRGMVTVFDGEEEAQELYNQYCMGLQAVTENCNQVYTEFLSECCEPVTGYKTSTNDLYKAFGEFCLKYNYPIIPYDSFSLKISACLKQFGRCKIRIVDRTVNGYVGLKIKHGI